MTVPAKQQQTKGRGAGQKRRLLLSRRPSRPMANRYVTVAGWSTHPARPVGWRPLEEEKMNDRCRRRDGPEMATACGTGQGRALAGRVPVYLGTAARRTEPKTISGRVLGKCRRTRCPLRAALLWFIQTISDGSSGSCAQPVRHLFSPNVALQHLTALPYFCRWNRPTWLPISSALKPRPFGLGNAAPLPIGLLFFVPRRLSVRPLHMQSSTLAAPFNIPSA